MPSRPLEHTKYCVAVIALAANFPSADLCPYWPAPLRTQASCRHAGMPFGSLRRGPTRQALRAMAMVPATRATQGKTMAADSGKHGRQSLSTAGWWETWCGRYSSNLGSRMKGHVDCGCTHRDRLTATMTDHCYMYSSYFAKSFCISLKTPSHCLFTWVQAESVLRVSVFPGRDTGKSPLCSEL